MRTSPMLLYRRPTSTTSQQYTTTRYRTLLLWYSCKPSSESTVVVLGLGVKLNQYCYQYQTNRPLLPGSTNKHNPRSLQSTTRYQLLLLYQVRQLVLVLVLARLRSIVSISLYQQYQVPYPVTSITFATTSYCTSQVLASTIPGTASYQVPYCRCIQVKYKIW